MGPKGIAISFTAILGFHFVAGTLSWYKKIWWLDIPMHLVGGVWVAFVFFYLFSDYWKIIFIGKKFLPAVVACLGFVALIGVFWEFYEYLADVYIHKIHTLFLASDPKLTFDSLKDIINDLIGASIVVVIMRVSEKTRGESLK